MKSFVIFIFLILSVNISEAATFSIDPNEFFPSRMPDNESNIKIESETTFKIDGIEYVAVNYYESYPEYPRLNWLNIALFQKYNDNYIKLLDKNLFDSGDPNEFRKPFLFETAKETFVIFKRVAGHGFNYFTIFRISPKIQEINIEDYHHSEMINSILKEDEQIFCRGPKYNFEHEKILAEINIYQEKDACCCPSRGSILFQYIYNGNEFVIEKAEKKKI